MSVFSLASDFNNMVIKIYKFISWLILEFHSILDTTS